MKTQFRNFKNEYLVNAVEHIAQRRLVNDNNIDIKTSSAISELSYFTYENLSVDIAEFMKKENITLCGPLTNPKQAKLINSNIVGEEVFSNIRNIIRDNSGIILSTHKMLSTVLYVYVESFIGLCSVLGMTDDEAYSKINILFDTI